MALLGQSRKEDQTPTASIVNPKHTTRIGQKGEKIVEKNGERPISIYNFFTMALMLRRPPQTKIVSTTLSFVLVLLASEPRQNFNALKLVNGRNLIKVKSNNYRI